MHSLNTFLPRLKVNEIDSPRRRRQIDEKKKKKMQKEKRI